MQRWFYANEEVVCDHPPGLTVIDDAAFDPEGKDKTRTWRFCVDICDRELMPNEALAVSGDCAQLGEWQFDKCVVMSPLIAGLQDKWQVYIDIPDGQIVLYRYLIVAIDPKNNQMIVRFFESHLNPRSVTPQTECVVDTCADIFGLIKCSLKVERGWLTTERILQLMFFNAPFKWREPSLEDHVMQVRVTPAFRRQIDPCAQNDDQASELKDLSIESDEHIDDENKVEENTPRKSKKAQAAQVKCGKRIPSFTKLKLNDCAESSTSASGEQAEIPNMDEASSVDEPELAKSEIGLSTAFAFNEVVNFNEKKDKLKRQPTFGQQCGANDLSLFHLTIGDFENTVYLIEFFTYSKNAAPDEEPYLVGYRYLLPEDLQSMSSGYVDAPIISASTHRLLGSMCFRFLVIRPTEQLSFDLSHSFLRHWGKKHANLDIGHRGQGSTYQNEQGEFVHENTVYSMQLAIANGADMIEFDVQLTMDAVPIVYHDMNVHVSQLNPRLLQNFDHIDLPVNKLTLKELRNFRLPKNVQRPSAQGVGKAHIGDDAEADQLFPLVDTIMDVIDEDIAYIIEIKWPHQFCNGKWHEGVKPRFDRNLYLDRILQVVIPKARKRRLVFACFDADMCSMLRFKQNLFPVMFLLPDESEKPYMDARSRYADIGINFAYAMELLGIIPFAQSLFDTPSIIGRCVDLKLNIFCYGVTGEELLGKLKKLGICGVILDRVDKLEKQEECNCPCCPQANAANDQHAGGESPSFKSLESWVEL